MAGSKLKHPQQYRTAQTSHAQYRQNIRATAATIPRIKLNNPSSKPTTKRQKAAPSLHALRKQCSHNAISIIAVIVDDVDPVVHHNTPHLM
jgi:hypothetical protein